ncbi:MAG: PDZ domain-containing protein, partial [Planctomycetales bacterium]
GVVSPKLRAQAKTPVLPGSESVRTAVRAKPKRDAAIRLWLGAKVKNVVGLSEVSSHGLPGETGVLLIDVPRESRAAAAGLKKSDAILKCNGKPIHAVDDLLRNMRAAAPGEKVKLAVVRRQADVVVEVERGFEIELHAGDAVKHGASGRYDPNKRFLGSWTDQGTWLEWDAAVSKPGRYAVEIIQACPNSQAGSEYVIHVGGAAVSGKVKATGGWENFSTHPVGTIEITEAGKLKASLKPTKKKAAAVMNLRAVVLRPL